jgi:hypothetical protein
MVLYEESKEEVSLSLVFIKEGRKLFAMGI